jgi:hypothetical protein
MALGKRVVTPERQKVARRVSAPVNTRVSLWSERWPAIALEECIELVEAAPPEDQLKVKRELPCQDCPKNTACLNAKRKEIGPLLYDREILTKPRSSESTLFPRDLFDPMLNPNRSMMPHYVKTPGLEKYEFVVSGWDLAWSEKVGGDHLVRTTAVVDLRNARKRLINMTRYPQGLTYTQQCRLITADYQKYREDIVVIEADAAQVIWAQTLENTTDVPVLRHNAGDDKKDLATGVPGLLIDLDSQRWDFPYMEDGLGFDTMQVFLSEMEAFGWVDGKLEGVGEHDDTVMSYWHCWWGLKLMGQTVNEFYNRNQDGRSE